VGVWVPEPAEGEESVGVRHGEPAVAGFVCGDLPESVFDADRFGDESSVLIDLVAADARSVLRQ
jgi:hypothetical protein